MNPCPSPDWLARLLAEELPPTDRSVVEAHVQQCQTCQQALEALTHDAQIHSAGSAEPATAPGLLCMRATADARTSSAAQLPEASLTAMLAPPQGMDELGRLGSYRILKVLGAGGMGIVFQAEDVQLARLVALKVLKPTIADPTSRQRFLREARACAALKNDHVVTIYQVGEADGIPFLAMEFLEGMSLEQWLENGWSITLAQILQIGRQTALGLAAAHDKGLIHRDIKPSNLWLDRDSGRIKVLDFGLARAQVENVHLTESGYIVGTPAYMAPEQARGNQPDFRGDLFSLGAVLYRLCTGTVPFKGDTTMAVLTALAVDTPTPVAQINPAISTELSDLIGELLTKDPQRRPCSAQIVARRLQELQQRLSAESDGTERTNTVKAQGDSTPRLLPGRYRLLRRTRCFWIAFVALIALGAGAVAIFHTGGRHGSHSEAVVPSTSGKPPDGLPPEYVNKLGMEFVRVPLGKAWLGGIGGGPAREEVELPDDFYLARYELTQGEWVQLMKVNPSHFARTGAGREAVKDIREVDLQRFPVESVSWADAQRFLQKLNERDQQPGWVYRLPTVVEWEYACRGGPMVDRSEGAFDFYFDRPMKRLPPGSANCDNTLGRTAKVGTYPPNRLGLYDMHGNVWEWCNDTGAAPYGKGWLLCGGAWDNEAWQCRAASRHVYGPGFTRTRGLRIARVPMKN
jgi:serine/threonine protein kinase